MLEQKVSKTKTPYKLPPKELVDNKKEKAPEKYISTKKKQKMKFTQRIGSWKDGLKEWLDTRKEDQFVKKYSGKK